MRETKRRPASSWEIFLDVGELSGLGLTSAPHLPLILCSPNEALLPTMLISRY